MKKGKITIFVITVIGFVLISLIGFRFALNNMMLNYLGEKYNIDKSQVTIIDYKRANIHFDYDFWEGTSINYFHNKWICKMNGRLFEVKYFHFHFVDDYQLEDLEQWATNYLQKNINPTIIGTVIYSNAIFHDPDIKYSQKLPYSDNRLWQENEIDKFIKHQFLLNQDRGIDIYMPEQELINEDVKKEITDGFNRTIFLNSSEVTETDINLLIINKTDFTYQRIYEFAEGDYGCQNILELNR